MIIDSAVRTAGAPVSDLDVYRLSYFVDAFAPLWELASLDRYRPKVSEPLNRTTRLALDQLVLTGIALPENVGVVRQPRPHIHAEYTLEQSRAMPVLVAIRSTRVGRREAQLVNEVVYGASPLLDGRLDAAFHLDATYVDPSKGPGDVLDLRSTAHPSTAVVARQFQAAVRTRREQEAELTNLYMAHLDRMIASE